MEAWIAPLAAKVHRNHYLYLGDLRILPCWTPVEGGEDKGAGIQSLDQEDGEGASSVESSDSDGSSPPSDAAIDRSSSPQHLNEKLNSTQAIHKGCFSMNTAGSSNRAGHWERCRNHNQKGTDGKA